MNPGISQKLPVARSRRSRNRRKGPGVIARIPRPGQLARGTVALAKRSAPVLVTLGIISGVAAASYAGYRFVTTSPRFAIAEIELSGAVASKEAVEATLASVRGANVFVADLDGLQAKLEQIPWIASATVDRDLPNGLEVVVTERSARAIVELGDLYLADAGGTPFKRVDLEAGEGAGLPLVTGLDRPGYLKNQAFAHATIVEAIGAFDRFSADPSRPRIGEVHLDQRRGITLFTYEQGTAIRVGAFEPDELPARLAAFDAAWRALAESERSHALTFHVDSTGQPDRVTVGFAQSE